jgi:hypothetical protein
MPSSGASTGRSGSAIPFGLVAAGVVVVIVVVPFAVTDPISMDWWTLLDHRPAIDLKTLYLTKKIEE